MAKTGGNGGGEGEVRDRKQEKHKLRTLFNMFLVDGVLRTCRLHWREENQARKGKAKKVVGRVRE